MRDDITEETNDPSNTKKNNIGIAPNKRNEIKQAIPSVTAL
tara:strand:+ start:325 stop:447 length:123 start_codon:yes stop_codon:yes gene_type:complete